MPLFPRHRRHHSWPYCGTCTNGRDRQLCRELHVSKLQSSAKDHFLSLEDPTATPLYVDVFYEDDAASAGIVRSKSARHHRLWSASKEEDETVSSITKADGTPKAVLRRVVLPQLDKARNIFPVHTTADRGEDAVMAYMVPVPLPSEKPTRARDRRQEKMGEISLEPFLERHHRRCHSEQPRAWREPSASLWTLLEE